MYFEALPKTISVGTYPHHPGMILECRASYDYWRYIGLYRDYEIFNIGKGGVYQSIWPRTNIQRVEAFGHLEGGTRYPFGGLRMEYHTVIGEYQGTYKCIFHGHYLTHSGIVVENITINVAVSSKCFL